MGWRKSPHLLPGTWFLSLYLAVLGLHCNMGFSVIVVSVDHSLFAVRGLLIVAASLVADHRL